MALGLIAGKHRQQHDGEHGQDHAEQRGSCLGEGLVRRGGTGKSYDLRVDGVIAQQRGRGHSAQASDKGHDGEAEHGGHQCGENHLQEHLKGARAHVPGSLHGVVVDAPDGVAQEERVVRCAGEGHGEPHRPKAGEPFLVHVGEDFDQLGGDDAVPGVEKQVPRHQGHAGVDHGGHVAQAEDSCALDVKILRQQHDGHAHNVHRDHQTHGQLQGIEDVAAHVPREEEPDHRPGVPAAVGVHRGKDAGQGVEAGHHHEADEEVYVQQEPRALKDGVLAQPDGFAAFHWATSSAL